MQPLPWQEAVSYPHLDEEIESPVFSQTGRYTREEIPRLTLEQDIDTVSYTHLFHINYPQDKLVRVVNGEVFDVAVDLREGSKTFGKWYGVVLSAENKKQFFIPKGFAHGFLVLSENAEFTYKCSDFYHPNDEGGLIWNDKDINVEWPIPEGMELIFSDKDQKWGSFEEYKNR